MVLRFIIVSFKFKYLMVHRVFHWSPAIMPKIGHSFAQDRPQFCPIQPLVVTGRPVEHPNLSQEETGKDVQAISILNQE